MPTRTDSNRFFISVYPSVDIDLQFAKHRSPDRIGGRNRIAQSVGAITPQLPLLPRYCASQRSPLLGKIYSRERL
ncbi:hypothetical protein EVAR_37180_1 [Eumeta japonica]|uniref:Uncharacterized protein n=1 Tax=Eumeta variegata TaxID=151549 RepID=A0A4C1WKL2_EUMVA|nr:hypothetical protein EVAR_37180_1 [Eumeta japonica]